MPSIWGPVSFAQAQKERFVPRARVREWATLEKGNAGSRNETETCVTFPDG